VTNSAAAPPSSPHRASWIVLIGLFLVFGEFQLAGSLSGSDRGQAGVPIALLIVGSLLIVERLFFGQRPSQAWWFLGLGKPSGRSIGAAVLVGAAMMAMLPLYAAVTGTSLRMLPASPLIVLGLFAQAGIAEETLFRGYLFHHYRQTRSFWRAAGAAAVPFVAVHVILLATMPWEIALGATLVAAATSFPLAHLFEMGRFTIWAPAIVHTVIQGGIKLVEVEGGPPTQLYLFWLAASAIVPFAAFLFARKDTSGAALRNAR
jgi:membrane protease YdiL (CAAX protease family)